MRRLYCNGTICTMANQTKDTEDGSSAVLTDDGRIIAVGDSKGLRESSPDAEIVDLEGGTMMPAFIDPHSHLSSYASSFLQVPLEECTTFDEIAERVKSFICQNAIEPGRWVIAKGYDHNLLTERKHPSLELADSCAPNNPLILQHASGHVGVFNSLAMKELGISPATVPPEGGTIGSDNGRLTGYMEENAYFTYIKKAPSAGWGELAESYKKAQDSYAAYGITSIQEGMFVKEMVPLYQQLTKADMLYLNVTGYACVPDSDIVFRSFPGSVGKFDKNFRIGGYKIFLDGSPQGRTAWMRKPYEDNGTGQKDYCGYGTMKDDDVMAALMTASDNGMQILAHCNGDAAAKQYLECIKRCDMRLSGREYCDDINKSDAGECGCGSVNAAMARLRPVMIHAQLLAKDQLSDVRKLGVIPSFFVAHIYHWGDVHVKNFGMERASHISPAGSALREGIRFTFHQDTPVVEPDMLETIWCAVNRITRSGALLGADERISVYEALKAVTVNAAYQYFDEDVKGSIEPGKNADFVILDKNPMKVSNEEIKDIKVMRTIKDDRVIFER